MNEQLTIVGYMNPDDGFLNKHCHNGYTEAVVLKADCDALHAEAEALRSGLRDPEAVLVGMLRGDIAKLSPRGIAKIYGQVLNGEDAQHVEIARLRTELESARGLLHKCREPVSMAHDTAYTPEEGEKYSALGIEIDAFLTATPAPEAPVVNQQFTAEQGERQEASPLFTCAGKGGEYAKLGYAKPAGAIKAIQGDSGLIIYRDTNDGQLYFRDPQDFNQRMMPLAVTESCSLGGDVIRQRTIADTTQPGPDVRGLVSFALELIDGAWKGGSFDGGDIQEAGVRHGLLVVEQRKESCGEHCDCAEYGFPSECYRLTPALAAHRKAQRTGESHDT